MKGNGRASLYEFRDLDLMFRLADLSWARTEQVAEAIGVSDRHAIGSRLSWMRRFGMLERDEAGAWALSDGGQRVVQARLRAATVSELEALPEPAMIETMAAITARYRLADPMIAHLLRREFLFGTQRR